ncbi:uncharacterized protein BCR38DRAFT_350860, partial [Pseudomassariella vexata]
FPAQCLGLQLLLDWAPQRLCNAATINCRWITSYFESISLKFAMTWVFLPDAQLPGTWAWGKNSAYLNYWVQSRL